MKVSLNRFLFFCVFEPKMGRQLDNGNSEFLLLISLLKSLKFDLISGQSLYTAFITTTILVYVNFYKLKNILLFWYSANIHIYKKR